MGISRGILQVHSRMTGLRFNIRELEKVIRSKLDKVTADAFRPEVTRFTKRTLDNAVKLTPIRAMATITAAQKKQYANRINYIPSVHELSDPTLIVKDDGHWLYAHGRWYAASFHRLPPEIEAIHYELMAERERRIQTSEGDFIAERAQARQLYRRSWWQAGQSLGINVAIDSVAIESHSRHNPPKEPPKAYGQWRGGKYVLTVVISNPMMNEESGYKNFDAESVLTKATAQARPQFDADLQKKLDRLIA